MKVLDKTVTRVELAKSGDIINDEMVKAVVDVVQEIVAIDAPMHADLEQFLLSQGSSQDDLWGINLYFGEDEDLIEFDSMINIRPRQGNRSRDVEDPKAREKITEVVAKWIK